MISKLQVILIPLIILSISYIVFLRGYEFDFSNNLRTFLDLGYPLGQAIYISVAILGYVLSRNNLGGLMKKSILIFIGALGAQYLADYMFLYQSSQGTFVGGGIVDFMYFVSYFIMALSLINLQTVFEKIKNS